MKRKKFYREDFEAPILKPPNRLNEREKRIVYNESKRGASEAELMKYFNTTLAEIRAAKWQGEIANE